MSYSRIFITSFVAIMAFVIFSGCERITPMPSPGNVQNFTQETEELKSLARSCGVPEDKIRNANALSLISEIKIKLDAKNSFRGEMLSESEKKDLDSYLSDAPTLHKKLKAYDAFIRQIDGHKIVIME